MAQSCLSGCKQDHKVDGGYTHILACTILSAVLVSLQHVIKMFIDYK